MNVLFTKFKNVFADLAMKKDTALDGKPRKMDIVSTVAMLSEPRIGTKSAQILLRHIRQFLGCPIVESEKKRRRYFGTNDYPPTCKKMVLEAKTVIPYWYKLSHELIKDQINEIVSEDSLLGLERVNFVVGGDHGGGKFRMTLKVLLVFSSKKSISKLYQIATVEHSKDETEILKRTVLQPIGDGLHEIASRKLFVVRKLSKGNKLSTAFHFLDDATDTPVICNVSSSLVVVGKLKFYFQTLGWENMSGSWCCWCTTHPSTWNTLCTTYHHNKEEDSWTIAKLKDYKYRIESGELKDARDKKGVVQHPVWDFIEPVHFMFP